MDNQIIEDITRLEHLIEQSNPIEIIYGKVINVKEDDETLVLQIEIYTLDELNKVQETNEIMEYYIDENCVPYFVATNGLVSSTMNEILNKFKEEKYDGFYDFYRFTLYENKVIQIHQGIH